MTDGMTDRLTKIRTPILHPVISRCDKKRVFNYLSPLIEQNWVRHGLNKV